ncbi:nucleoside 2-deoxyribosyltransferase domain-containing protein [Streptomyces sp. NRRL S-1868]|uniref:nucleoside 2-deoxyribosyltransferase domain-containing protein n=1 Tax=Streptomyces sp. NRRL S-1868 TaxID=1463892 RepID=UPI00131CB4F3|nr:nucleoside 2-deoxyribosyltransferase domain-containing protein [Streptomyces sp. NRRL S-1868]
MTTSPTPDAHSPVAQPAPSPHHVSPAPRRTVPQRLYIEAPTYYRPQHSDPPCVFLAGGITGVAEQWHRRAIEALNACTDPLVIINPNRAAFPIHDPKAAWEQVSWEQHHLHLPALTTLFWFAAAEDSRPQPIAMFELGQALGENRKIVVGAHPRYPREADVHMLCQLARPGMPVYSDLEDTVHAAYQAATALSTECRREHRPTVGRPDAEPAGHSRNSRRR